MSKAPTLSEIDPPSLMEACPECGALIDVTSLDFFALAPCPDCGTTFRVRSMMPEYTIEGLISEGALGPVLRTRDLSDDKEVVLKAVAKRHVFPQESISRFEADASQLASLEHPNILPFLSFGSHYGDYFVIAELAPKGTLADLIHLQGQIAEVQVLEIAIQAVEGLRAAASVGVHHHDIKPSNIMFASATHVKVADFGVAILLEEEARARGSIWGTPNYVCPEKLRGEEMDHRSDMYSLGCTLFQALSGRAPFEAEESQSVARKHLEAAPLHVGSIVRGISRTTDEVIDRLLQKSPADRFATYDDLLAALFQAKEHLQEELKRRSAEVTMAKTSKRLNSASQKIRSGKVRSGQVVLPFGGSSQAGDHLPIAEPKKKSSVMLWVGIGCAVLAIAGVGVYIESKPVAKPTASPAPESTPAVTSASPAVALNPHQQDLEKSIRSAGKAYQDGNASTAETQFKGLLEDDALTSAQRSMVKAQLGLIQLLDGRFLEGRSTLQSLQNVKFGSQQRNDILIQGAMQSIGSTFSSIKRIDPSVLQSTGQTPLDGLLSLYRGMKNWGASDFYSAGSFLARYESTGTMEPFGWVDCYKASVARYVGWSKEYREILDEIGKVDRGAMAGPELLKRVTTLKEKVTEKKFATHLQDLVEQLQKQPARNVLDAIVG